MNNENTEPRYVYCLTSYQKDSKLTKPTPMAGWKRLHTLPHRFHRYGTRGATTFEQLRGMPDTPRQRYLREQSLARFNRRPDASTITTATMATGEIGSYEGFRFISDTNLPTATMVTTPQAMKRIAK